ncbi:hypothetical protein [Pseudolysinimonas sp.]|jgi:hypothetical protein|uniref:hypothetical protein n=1 Tax=Pseudolysinimonas sp. TaxID=2680009 RepID=UPI0037851D0F
MRATVPAVTLAAAAVLAMTGCTAPAETPDADPPSSTDQPCLVGTWQLDVADYAAQSEAFVLGLGLPIEGFAMTGAGTITFTADGLVATDIDLRTTGTIVAGDTRVPLDQPSAYTGSGDWAAGAGPDTVDLANWANVPDPDVPVSPDAPPVPAIDYTDIPTVSAVCTEDDLLLQGPDAPLSALWHR